MKRKTILSTVELSGTALHSGESSTITFRPAQEGAGLFFVRYDLPGKPKVRAIHQNVSDTKRGTFLEENGAKAQVIEHVLAAVSALGISDLEIGLGATEPPAMDGSALPFLLVLKKAGTSDLPSENTPLIVKRELVLEDGDSIVYAYPSDRFRISFVIDFPGTAIGRQEFSLEVNEKSFEENIAPARTFGFLDEIEELKKHGLGLGASLENALAVSEKGYVNKPRFKDEPVKHKVLDLIGDLALLGRPLIGNIVAERSSHRLNAKLVSMLLRDNI